MNLFLIGPGVNFKTFCKLATDPFPGQLVLNGKGIPGFNLQVSCLFSQSYHQLLNDHRQNTSSEISIDGSGFGRDMPTTQKESSRDFGGSDLFYLFPPCLARS